jgi:hypothetical protein
MENILRELKDLRAQLDEVNHDAAVVCGVIMLLGDEERITYAVKNVLLPAYNMGQWANLDPLYLLIEREWELNGKGGRVGENVE